MSVADSIPAPPTINGLIEAVPVPYSYNTIGWKVTAVAVFVIVIVGVWKWTSWWNASKNRRVALKSIGDSPSHLLSDLSVLKSMAIQSFGRPKVASLTGSEWLMFLDQSCKGVKFQVYEDVIKNVVSGETPSADEYSKLNWQIKKWIKHHDK